MDIVKCNRTDRAIIAYGLDLYLTSRVDLFASLQTDYKKNTYFHLEVGTQNILKTDL